MANPISRRKNRNNNTTETEMVDVSEAPMEIQEETMTEEILTEENPISDNLAEETETLTEETPKSVIPDVLAQNPILVDFCKRYLNVLNEISAYNDKVLAEKDKEWDSNKVLARAKEFANPTDANVAPKDEIREAFTAWENLVSEVNKAKRNVIDLTAKELGITINVANERDSEVEKPLKEARNLAVEIGKQLSMIAKMTTDESATEAVTSFLANNPLPIVGRRQETKIGGNEKTTPKYRVDVKVYDQDGTERISEAGFTKTALALKNFYPQGEALESSRLRAIWEAAGNNSEVTVQEVVEFDDNNLHFVISKRK